VLYGRSADEPVGTLSLTMEQGDLLLLGDPQGTEPQQIVVSNNDFTLNGVSVSVSGSLPNAVTLRGGSGEDRFTITPVPTRRFTLDAGAEPLSGFGDEVKLLGVDAAQVTNHASGVGSGELQISGYLPIAYSGLENVTYGADTAAPAVLSVATNPEVSMDVVITFSESVGSTFAVEDLSLISVATGQPAPAGSFTLETALDNSFRTVGRLRLTSLPAGNWRLTIAAHAVADGAGNVLASESTFTFRHLPGDLNQDGVVDFADLLKVAQNWGQTGKSFSQGNANHDENGLVDFDDLLLIAQHYGVALISSPTSKAKAKRAAVNVLS
jgi:hypothetical protein